MDVASLLTDLTKKGPSDPVQWMELCQQAFTQVNSALCGKLLLHSPSFSLPFILHTGLLDRWLGAVLSQVVVGEEHPVLLVRALRYRTIEKACLAIKWPVLTLQYYLLEQAFTLCLDHALLQ